MTDFDPILPQPAIAGALTSDSAPGAAPAPAAPAQALWQTFVPHILSIEAMPVTGILSVGVRSDHKNPSPEGLLEISLTQPFPVEELMVVRQGPDTFMMPAKAFFDAFRPAPDAAQPQEFSNES